MCDTHSGPDTAFGNPSCDNCHKAIMVKFDEWIAREEEKEKASFIKIVDPKPKIVQNYNLPNYVWVTVNPRDGVTVDELMKKVHKMYKKVWIQKCAYVFEIGKNGRHHSHGLIKVREGFRNDKTKSLLANSVKDITDIKNDHCFCVRFIDEEAAKEKLRYMMGEKADEKQDAVIETQIWRSEFDIQNMYGDSTLLVSPQNQPI